MNNRVLLHEASAMACAIEQVADSIISEFGADGLADVALLGIYKSGVPLAGRIAEVIRQRTGRALQIGTLDISMYRDDFGQRSALPLIRETEIPFDVDAAKLILVDDVLHTGRTVRAAIEAIFRQGRPKAIQLAVMIDRGHRELPIRPDFVGKNIPTAKTEKVLVKVEGIDGETSVSLYSL